MNLLGQETAERIRHPPGHCGPCGTGHGKDSLNMVRGSAAAGSSRSWPCSPAGAFTPVTFITVGKISIRLTGVCHTPTWAWFGYFTSRGTCVRLAYSELP